MSSAQCNTNDPPCWNGVLTYVPDTCGSLRASDANLADANSFDLANTDYYKDQVGSLVPGIVLGAFSLVGFVLMITWICVRFCRRRKLACSSPPTGDTQFLTASSMACPPLQPRLGRRQRCADVLTALMVLFAVATVGVAAWGMGQSIKATDSTVTNFWDLVYDVQNLTNFAATQLQGMSQGLSEMSNASAVLSTQMGVLVPVIERAGLPIDASQLVDLAAKGQGALESAAQATMEVSVEILRDDVLDALLEVMDWESPTMSIEDTWRYVVFAVLFGLMILFVIVATATCFYMRFGRWASFTVALVWLLTAVTCLVGIGLMNGVQTVSEDACLYTETYIYNQVAQKVDDPNTRMLITAAMNYYFGLTNLPNVTKENVAATQLAAGYSPEVVSALLWQITQRDYSDVLFKAQDANATLYQLLSGPQLEQAVQQAGLPESTAAAVRQLYRGAQGVLTSTAGLALGLLRTNVEPLYHQVKEYICCDINGAAYDVWVPWTVTGVIGIVYSLLASARIVWQTFIPQDKGWAGTGSKQQLLVVCTPYGMALEPPGSASPGIPPGCASSSTDELYLRKLYGNPLFGGGEKQDQGPDTPKDGSPSQRDLIKAAPQQGPDAT